MLALDDRDRQESLKTILVVPCFDEAARLEPRHFLDGLADSRELELLFVDDGSRDATPGLLEALRCDAKDRIQVLRLPGNVGKAEAVRVGMQAALERSPAYVGYWDADLATPLADVQVFRDRLASDPTLAGVFGARVQLLGAEIERKALRHAAGRVQATVISALLGLPLHDAQCGAKLFRATPDVGQLFAEPFVSRWLFDVELVARLAQLRGSTASAGRAICEIPVSAWRDVPGSKVGLGAYGRSAFDLLRLIRVYPAFRGRTSFR